ncbi:MAG TPA: 3'-5' exonuclease [Gemmatimonadales bacterium]|nr:3'-5' exonuclease [Gemmatimonadales bacterium]
MTGLSAHPTSTLADRALALLAAGPADALVLARDVLGLSAAPPTVAARLAVALLGADPRVRQLGDGRWALAGSAQGSPLLSSCAFAVVDVETTGMRAAGDDRVTELAVVLLHGDRTELVFDSLINPGCPISPQITALTGITDAMVADAPTFDMAADAVLAALAGRVFVAHNVRFDWGFVDAELRRNRGLALDGPRLCTVRLSRRLVRGLTSHALDQVTAHFNLDNGARHRAAGDALVTAEILRRLLAMAEEQGARTLEDLEALKAGKRGSGEGNP